MTVAVDAGEEVRGSTWPNPWVGAVVVPAGATTGDGRFFVGATAPPGGPHAEVGALRAAGDAARGGTLYVTLEPCSHHGRTPPCTDAIVASGVARVVYGIEDPDPHVAGSGLARLRQAGLAVGHCARSEVEESLWPYLHHRRTARPGVVLKLAMTLDGRTAAPDGTSQWITGEEARLDAHRLRSRVDAIVVGAGTVRSDDPALTVRLPEGDPRHRGQDNQPQRIVLGGIPDGARVLPARGFSGELEELLDLLGSEGHLEILVEGGAGVAHDFHAAGLVNRYVLYVAPVLAGGSDALGVFSGPGAPTLDAMWRGQVLSVSSLGADLRLEVGRSLPGAATTHRGADRS
jgi:diaminohydroxyphosphoribosylaminopyrimidine deaminase/5-amino-6-(5-phosphoribosylamino)uracil reductase